MVTRSESKSDAVRPAILAFVASGLVVMVVILAVLVTRLRADVRNDAIREARDVTVAEGRSAIVPLLNDAVLRGEPDAIAEMDRQVRARVLSDDLVRVKIWSSAGRIIYSDETSLIGQTFELSDEDLEALTTGTPHADLSNLDEEENSTEAGFGQLLQVYDGLEAPSGQPVLFEAYLRPHAIHNSSSLDFLVPSVIAAFVLLFVLQLPLAWRLARRVQRALDERAAMVERTLRSHETERRRIAADLHDGIVQQLAGSAYSLAAAAEHADQGGLHGAATIVRNAATELRLGLRDLRSLLATMAPPHLERAGLDAAFDALATSARSSGLHVDLHYELPPTIDGETENLVLRTAQEALRNVIEHAHASRVTIVAIGNPKNVMLRVFDNGCGFDPSAPPRRDNDAHLGLRLLDELARDAGGEFRVTSRSGRGTLLELQVPSA